MKLKLVSILATALLATGCASTKFGDKGDSAESLKVPEWYLKEASVSDMSISATSTDISTDMQYAIDKATFNAQVILARHLNTQIESLQRSSVRETSTNIAKIANVHTDSVSKATTNQTLSFFTRTKLEVIKENNSYRAFVMLQLPVRYAEQLTGRKFTDNAEESFKRLDNETKKQNAS